MNRNVYFFEAQISMGNCVYLPLVSGILQSYAQTFEVINDNYEFKPFIFMRDTPENMIKDVYEPYIIAFSISIWNHQLSLECAIRIKNEWPFCIIVFGGPQVTDTDKPYCDYIIKEEGEKKFVTLLGDLIGVTIDINNHNLENYPSPYTKGLYAQYLERYPNISFQAIIETNRGCPFTCSFCYWGQGFDEKKVRHHDLKHVEEEAEWIGRNKIKYIFVADANFGMYERDQEIAKIYVKVKEKYGYPEKIRVCYGKNKEENVFKTAKILHDAGMAKAVTLSKQSNSIVALDNIKRNNIKLSVYDNLCERYYKEGIPTYTELILGLPGETADSFKKGVAEVANSQTQLFVYHCTVLPNTEMCKEEYIRKYGLKTVRLPIAEIHGEIRRTGMVTEYEDIVIGTNTMTTEEWIDCAVFAWEAQLRNSFGINEIPQSEINRFYQIAENITNGYSRGQVDPLFGKIYWEPEEVAYLRIAHNNRWITGTIVQWAKENVIYGRKSAKKVRI
jgi:radical SAM superfamily enzyme YgiQ (UPF0313 family)